MNTTTPLAHRPNRPTGPANRPHTAQTASAPDPAPTPAEHHHLPGGLGQPTVGFGQPTAPPPAQGRARHDTDRDARALLAWQMSIRAQVASRLRAFNTNHAMHAWEWRNRVPIAAHAVALLYVDPAAPTFRTVAVAGRLLADTPDVADVFRMLVDLTAVATDVIAAGADPRTEMSEAPEPMSAHAFYHGVAVSTLDTARGPWHTVRGQVTSYPQIPGDCYALLADATAMRTVRGGMYAHPEYQVWTTHPMDWISGAVVHHMRAAETTTPVWHQLGRLHHTFAAQRTTP